MGKLFSGIEIYRRKPGGQREQKAASRHSQTYLRWAWRTSAGTRWRRVSSCGREPFGSSSWLSEATGTGSEMGGGGCLRDGFVSSEDRRSRDPRRSGLSTRDWAGGWVIKSNYGAGGRSGFGSHLYLECEGVLWPLLTSPGSQACTWCPYLHTGKTVKHVTQDKSNKDIFNKPKQNPKLPLTPCQILVALPWGPQAGTVDYSVSLEKPLHHRGCDISPGAPLSSILLPRSRF